MEVRVNVAAPGAHHQTFLRRKTHRGIHALAIADRCCAASVAQMRRDQLRLSDRCAQPFGSLQRDKMMTRTVESVPADPVLFVVLVRDCIMKGVSRQSLVKRSIEHGHLLLIREQFGCDANALCACRVMKWCEIREFLDSPQDALCHQDGQPKILPSMDDAMSDRF